MNIQLKKIDGTKREINIEVTGDIVKNKFEAAFKKIGLEAKVAGFRPGHVPRDILEKNFFSAANEYVIRELIPEIYDQAIAKESLDVLGLPGISDVKLDRSMLSFKAQVEVRPEINLKNYKGIKLKFRKIEVGLEDIKRHIDSLKESRKADNVDDAFAKSLGYPNLPQLEKAIETQIFIQKQRQQHNDLEEELINNVMSELDFKVPEALINRQIEELVKQIKLDMLLKGAPADKIQERENALPQELYPQAKEQVRVYLVLSEIARKENIPQDEHMSQKAIELLFREADWEEAAA